MSCQIFKEEKKKKTNDGGLGQPDFEIPFGKSCEVSGTAVHYFRLQSLGTSSAVRSRYYESFMWLDMGAVLFQKTVCLLRYLRSLQAGVEAGKGMEGVQGCFVRTVRHAV